jgi:hypothetical protein
MENSGMNMAHKLNHRLKDFGHALNNMPISRNIANNLPSLPPIDRRLSRQEDPSNTLRNKDMKYIQAQKRIK